MSSSASAGICVSTCSIALVPMRCSLSSSTTTASIDRPVWNLISSSACRLVGSETATNRRLPRLTSGSTRCLASSLSETSLTVSMSGWMASRSSSGTPNSCEAAMAISRAFARLFATRCETRLVLASLAATIASCMDFSSSKPSWMRRSGRPCRARRCALTAGMTFSAMDFRGYLGRCGVTNYRRCRWQAIVKLPGILRYNARRLRVLRHNSGLSAPCRTHQREKPLQRRGFPVSTVVDSLRVLRAAGCRRVLRQDRRRSQRVGRRRTAESRFVAPLPVGAVARPQRQITSWFLLT